MFTDVRIKETLAQDRPVARALTFDIAHNAVRLDASQVGDGRIPGGLMVIPRSCGATRNLRASSDYPLYSLTATMRCGLLALPYNCIEESP